MTKIAPLTCEQREELERAARLKCKTAVTTKGASNTDAVAEFFFSEIFSGNGAKYEEAVFDSLFCGEICRPRNYAEKCEGCCTCDGECCGCDDTLCHDPDKCVDKHVGIGYLELVDGYRKTMEMPDLPVSWKQADLKDGDMLVWDANATPCNDDCDPCTHPIPGAWRVLQPKEIAMRIVNDEEAIAFILKAIRELGV